MASFLGPRGRKRAFSARRLPRQFASGSGWSRRRDLGVRTARRSNILLGLDQVHACSDWPIGPRSGAPVPIEHLAAGLAHLETSPGTCHERQVAWKTRRPRFRLLAYQGDPCAEKSPGARGTGQLLHNTPPWRACPRPQLLCTISGARRSARRLLERTSTMGRWRGPRRAEARGLRAALGVAHGFSW